MSDVSRILLQAQRGDRQAAAALLPLVYEELRRLAAARLAHENPGQTLQATALVHEAYLRLIGREDAECWENRGHFFAAAAEATSATTAMTRNVRTCITALHSRNLTSERYSIVDTPVPANDTKGSFVRRFPRLDGPHSREAG